MAENSGGEFELMTKLLPDWSVEHDAASTAALANLAELLLDGQVSAVVGAGAAASVGLPTWDLLLDRMAAQLDDSKIGPNVVKMLAQMDTDLLWRAEEYRLNFETEGAYHEFLRSEFSKQFEALPQLLIDIVRLSFKHIFTTNYDTALEQAHAHHYREEASELNWYARDDVRSLLADLSRANTRRHYVHLHGVCSRPEHIVLTYSDYVRQYLESDETARRLFVLFATQHFVFIGFSLNDADFVQILREVSSRLGKGKTPAHYAVLPCTDPSSAAIERRRLRKKFDIDAIFYHQAERGEHTGLQKILSTLVALKTWEDLTEFRRLLGFSCSTSAPDSSSGRSDSVQAADPQKNRWGGQPRRNGRELSAEVTEIQSDWFRIDLTVKAIGNEPVSPLTGRVVFHLHDSFYPQIRESTVQSGVSTLSVPAYGAFTVGAEADEGRTQLELDLSADPRFPTKFRES